MAARGRHGKAAWAVRLGMLLGLGCAWGQTAASDVVYHLHGTVVDGVTGKPLGRALVTSVDRRLATMTDSEGRFGLEVSVPPSMAAQLAQANGQSQGMIVGIGGVAGMRSYGGFGLMLQAQRPGYLPPGRPVTLPLDATLSEKSVTLKLLPAARIAGHVAASGVEGARGVNVTLLMHRVEEGERVWSQAGSQQTDAQGEFHFANLQPGEYTVMTSEWRGEQPLPLEAATARPEYPPVFYGDVPDLTGATKLQLKYGETARTELHLEPAMYYPVNLPVAGAEFVNVQVGKGGPLSGYNLGYNQRDHAVTGLLPSGDYTLTLSSYGREQGFAVVPLHVAGAGVQGAGVALAPAGKVEVRVRAELTGQTISVPGWTAAQNASLQASQNAQPLTVYMNLRPEDQAGGTVGGTGKQGSELDFNLENVHPGRYFVRAQPSRGYVASLRSGDVDLEEHLLMAGQGGTADPIEVTVRDDGGTVSGTVKESEGTGMQQTFVFLLPAGETGRFAQGFVDPRGRYTVMNVVPGSYRVVASRQNPYQLPYRDKLAMRPYETKGAPVEVLPRQQAQADLSVVEDEGALP